MQNAPWPTLALTASATLVTGFNDILDSAFVAQVINILYIPTFEAAYQNIFQKAGIDMNLSVVLWNNTRYAFEDKFKLGFWVNAAIDGIDSPASLMLRDHFLLDYTIMYSVLE